MKVKASSDTAGTLVGTAGTPHVLSRLSAGLLRSSGWSLQGCDSKCPHALTWLQVSLIDGLPVIWVTDHESQVKSKQAGSAAEGQLEKPLLVSLPKPSHSPVVLAQAHF